MKNFNTAFLGLVLILGLSVSVSHPAYAGKITIKVDKGSEASVSYTLSTPPFGSIQTREPRKTDVNMDGEIEITFGDGSLAYESRMSDIWVSKISDGEPTGYEIKLNPTGITIASLEPFDVPTFSAATDLFVSIDIVALLGTGNPFTIGQTLDVINGILAESPYIVFKDASSLPANSDFSRALINSLPTFTGSVSVFSFDNVAAIPEPSTLALVGLAVLGMLGCARRTKRPNDESESPSSQPDWPPSSATAIDPAHRDRENQ